MTIYLDCSKEFVLPENYGIPRVVHSLARSNEFKLVVFGRDKFYEIPFLNRPNSSNNKNSLFSIIRKNIHINLNKILPNYFRSILFRLSYKYKISKKISGLVPILLKEDDVIIYPDLFGPQITNNFKPYLKEKGVVSGFVLYDIIPITSPEFFRKIDLSNYKNYLDICINNQDFFISISKTVKNKFEKYLNERNLKMKGDFFYLGTDFSLDNNQYKPSEYLKKIFQKPTYILVSTFEPRKNHQNVLKAFEILWKERKDINLFFIGKKGWKSKSLMKELENHSELNKRLFFSHNINDQELDFCYRNAKKLITASFDEGFNLPLVEALSRNTQVLASNIEIHREVASDACVYFDPNKPEDLAEKIIEDKQIQSFRDAKIYTWDQSVNMLIASIQKLI